MIRKLSAACIIILALMVGLFSCAKKDSQEIKIGAVFSQTGPLAPYGEKALDGFHLAVEEIKRGGLRVQVIFEDAQSTPQGAVSAFQKLVTIHKVPVVVGPEASSLAMAIAPLANKFKVVLFAPTVSVDAYTTPNDYTFRNWPAARVIAEKMALVAYRKLNLRKVGIIYINNDMGVSYITSFRKKFEELGGQAVLSEAYSPEETDFRSQLSKIKLAKPDAMYLLGQVEMGQALKQAKELGIAIPILSGIGIEDPKVKEVAGDLINGIVYTSPAYNPKSSDPTVTNYEKSFEQRYNRQSEIFAAATYDAMKILEKVLKEGNRTSDQVKDALFKIRDFPGVTGTISFDFNGDVIKDVAVKKIVNGEFVFLDAELRPIR